MTGERQSHSQGEIMKIARFKQNGVVRIGVVLGEEIADVSSVNPAIPDDLRTLLESDGISSLNAYALKAPRVLVADVELLAPIAQPPEFLAIGLNYFDHIVETQMVKPDGVPMVFNKQSTCITGPNDPIVIPTAAPDNVDYEGELGIVIGKKCRSVKAKDARSVIGGYLVVNDVSVRDWQMQSATMTMGKSWDTHGPIGPWLVTDDEIGNPNDLRLQTWVDGELRQDARTSALIHSCEELIEYLTTAFTLLPGTIIATGTPAGVGFKMNPPGLLKPGQRVRVEIEGIGYIDNPVIADQ